MLFVDSVSHFCTAGILFRNLSLGLCVGMLSLLHSLAVSEFWVLCWVLDPFEGKFCTGSGIRVYFFLWLEAQTSQGLKLIGACEVEHAAGGGESSGGQT